MKKIFVGGYLECRILSGAIGEGAIDYDENVDVYNLEEVLELGFVSSVVEYYEDIRKDENIEFYDLSDDEKIRLIREFTEDDDIASLEIFETEEEALARKEEILEFRAEMDKCIKNEEIVNTGTASSPNGWRYDVYEVANNDVLTS